jgi:hypothetical protein
MNFITLKIRYKSKYKHALLVLYHGNIITDEDLH